MNEACLNLFGEGMSEENSREFAIKTLEFMRERMTQYQEETGNNYNLEATPAEGTGYRLARLDKRTYPDIKCANEPDYQNGAEPFYTNSTHLPVAYSDDVFEVLDKQDDLQTKYTGGTVLHIFLGERINDNDSVKKLVKKICENYSLPYFTFSPTFSICPSHGYIRGEEFQCPTCNEDTEVYTRVVGFHTPVNRWNKGKKEEFKMRKLYNIETAINKDPVKR